MLKHILPQIPAHRLYCEPFLGGGAVFWSKKPSEVEVLNDLNGSVVNFYQICKTEFSALRTLITATPHSREMHRKAELALKYPEMHSSLIRAWAFYVQTTQSFGAQLFTGWGYERKSKSTSLNLYNKRSKFIKSLQQRLNLVQIECNDALKVIASRDSVDSFFYLDPPYFNSDCGHYAGYTENDYRRLLELLTTIKGRFLLSSYPSELLSQFIDKNAWSVKTVDSKVAVSNKVNKTKTEVLIANYPI